MFLCLAIDSSSNNMLVPRLANRAHSNPNAIPSQLPFAMPSIGPQIPAHLLKPSNRADSDDEDDGPQPVNIGPRIPAHLLSAKSGESKTQVFDDDDDDDFGPSPQVGPSIGPSMPPRSSARAAPEARPAHSRPMVGPSMPPPAPSASVSAAAQGKRPVGPSLPKYAPMYDPSSGYGDESDSDDDVGPKPLPAGMHHEAADPVKEFMEREEKRRKLAEARRVCAFL